MNKKRIILLVILAAVLTGGLIAYKMWNKPFADASSGDAIQVTSVQLFKDFNSNEAAAQKKYVPQTLGSTVVEVSGNIKEVGKNDAAETYFYLATGDPSAGVKCIIEKGSEISDAKAGDNVVIRGFCDGIKKDTIMDLVIMDIIINRCKPLKAK